MEPLEIRQKTFSIGGGWCVGRVEEISDTHVQVIWTDGITEQGVQVERDWDEIKEVIKWLLACYGAQERNQETPDAPEFIQDSDWFE